LGPDGEPGIRRGPSEFPRGEILKCADFSRFSRIAAQRVRVISRFKHPQLLVLPAFTLCDSMTAVLPQSHPKSQKLCRPCRRSRLIAVKRLAGEITQGWHLKTLLRSCRCGADLSLRAQQWPEPMSSHSASAGN
jgi:hypothetical protein